MLSSFAPEISAEQAYHERASGDVVPKDVYVLFVWLYLWLRYYL